MSESEFAPSPPVAHRCKACGLDIVCGPRPPVACPKCRALASFLKLPPGASHLSQPQPRRAWGPTSEVLSMSSRLGRRQGESAIDDEVDEKKARIIDPATVDLEPFERSPTGVQGLDHVLSGGIAEGYIVMLAGAPGTMKCLGLGTPVIMFDGSTRPVEDVREGDVLMGPDSKPRKVLSTNTGYGPLYEIQPVKGDAWVCNDAHVLTLTGTRKKRGRVIDVPLYEHVANCEAKGKRLDVDWKLFRVAVRFDDRDVPIDPYLLGLWIGDGTLGESQITNREPEIINFCEKASAQYGLQTVLRYDTPKNTYNIRFRSYSKYKPGEAHRPRPSRSELRTQRPKKKNLLKDFFRDHCQQDGAKKIPQEYLVNSESVRLDLLAGILDTDGCLDAGGCYALTTVSDRLCEQYLFLARSLGFAAYARKGTAKINSTGFSGEYWYLGISGDLDRIPCKVKRRKAKARKQIKRVSVTGFSAMPIGEGDFYGFEIDGDGRFLLGDFTVTHNSTLATQAASYLQEHGAHFGEDMLEDVVAYGSAEEDERSVIETARRVAQANFKIVLSTSVQQLIEGLDSTGAVVWVVDSLMTITSDALSGGEPGGPSQVNACATLLFHRSHAMGPFKGMGRRSIFLIAHGTKDGDLAGPMKALHAVDGCVQMEHVDPIGDLESGRPPWSTAPDQTRPTGYVSARVYRKMRKADGRRVSYFQVQPYEIEGGEESGEESGSLNPLGGRLDHVEVP